MCSGFQNMSVLLKKYLMFNGKHLVQLPVDNISVGVSPVPFVPKSKMMAISDILTQRGQGSRGL